MIIAYAILGTGKVVYFINNEMIESWINILERSKYLTSNDYIFQALHRSRGQTFLSVNLVTKVLQTMGLTGQCF